MSDPYVVAAAFATLFAVCEHGAGFVVLICSMLCSLMLWAEKDAQVIGKPPSAAFPTRHLKLGGHRRICRAICNTCDEDARSECQCKGDGKTECSDTVYHANCRP